MKQGWIAFTWIVRLDKKKRLVLPVELRDRLGISDSVELNWSAEGLKVSKPNEYRTRPASRNISEVCLHRLIEMAVVV